MTQFQRDTDELKKKLPTILLSAGILAVVLAYLVFVICAYHSTHRDSMLIAKASFGLDLDISCDAGKCSPEHLHLDRSSFNGGSSASGKVEAAGVIAHVSLESGGRVGEMQIDFHNAQGACPGSGSGIAAADKSHLPKESWALTRDASVFNSDITMSAPDLCGKPEGNVHIRLHSSMLPRDF